MNGCGNSRLGARVRAGRPLTLGRRRGTEKVAQASRLPGLCRGWHDAVGGDYDVSLEGVLSYPLREGKRTAGTLSLPGGTHPRTHLSLPLLFPELRHVGQQLADDRAMHRNNRFSPDLRVARER